MRQAHLRIARPVRDLERSVEMYCRGLGMRVIDGFRDHGGFDGAMLALEGADWHFELTSWRTHPVEPKPTPEDLTVLYLPDASEWKAACESVLSAGFTPVESFWDANGCAFEDCDGYRIVLQNDAWSAPRAF